MLVRDYTPVYSPLGRWAGRIAPSRMGAYGDTDWGSVISGIGTAVKDTVASVTTIAVAANQKPSGSTTATSPYVSPIGTYQPPQQQVVQHKSMFSDPLVLGAVGLAVLGLGAVVLGRRRGGRMSGFSFLPRFARHTRRRRPSRRR